MKSIQYIGKEVTVKIEQPIGSSHPEYPETIYAVNYGFLPNTMSGDGEELDAYVLGEKEPLEEYTGKCIAVIHRLKEDDDKLIVVPFDQTFTVQEIKKETNFIEKYFQSIIIT